MDEIIDQLKEAFKKNIGGSDRAAQLLAQLNAGGGYPDAYDYADEVGQCLENAMRDVLTGYVGVNTDALSEEQLWALLCSAPSEAYKLVQDAAETAQVNTNTASGLGLKALGSQLLGSRLSEDVDKLKGLTIEEAYQELLSVGRSLPGDAVADTMEKNAEFQKGSGLSPKIVRTMGGETCAFCARLAGTYDYPCDKRVYVRHPNCDCSVNYFPNGTGSGKKYQNAHGSRSVWRYT